MTARSTSSSPATRRRCAGSSRAGSRRAGSSRSGVVTRSRPTVDATRREGAVADAALIYGLHSVRAALAAGTDLREIWVLKNRRDKRLEELLAAAKRAGVEPQPADRVTLDRLAGTSHHQGVV